MSDFHDALRRAARQHGEAVASGLTADAVVTSSVHDISRGRRRRSATQAGVGALGAVAVGLAGWLVLPLAGAGDSEPAGPDGSVNAGPYRYDVGSEGEIADPAIMLRGDDRVMCGDELSLEPGVTVHSPQAFESELWLEAELTTLRDTIGVPTAAPRPLDPDDPDGIMTGWDPDSPTWTLALGGIAQSIEATPLLMDDGAVVGLGQGTSTSNNVGGNGSAGGGANIPRVDDCGDSERTLEELLDLEYGDPMDTLIVAQFWAPNEDVTDPGGTLLATIVVDPHEPANFTESPSTRDYSPEPEPNDATPEPVEPVELRAPEGDEHQAFVVAKPQPGCSPLADLRAAGHPTTENAEYTVVLPGATDDLTGELWGAEPVVTHDRADSRWYVGRDAWMVADEVSAGIPDPHLEWIPLSDGGWALSSGGDDAIRGQECAYDAPIPEVDGAMFLVIDGADWGSADLSSVLVTGFNLDDYQTWVYLGEAD